MGLFADILESNREREYSGYIDPCAIMWSFQDSQHSFEDYREKLNQYEPGQLSSSQLMQMREMLQEKSFELERLKAGYLIAEKSILEIINRRRLQSSYMLDMLNALQHQMQDAYRGICKLIMEIDQKVGSKSDTPIELENEDSIRVELLNRLIKTIVLHMEKGIFQDTSSFRKVVSDCAELIRYLKNEEYLQSDKMILNYYLSEDMGLKTGHHICKNCRKPLLSNVPYCLNCYERN